METEITLKNLRIMAQRAGLKLADDELQSLLPGINRLKKQAVELRPLMAQARARAVNLNEILGSTFLTGSTPSSSPRPSLVESTGRAARALARHA